jgi:monoterpene epsilon-lactone hydrolase
MSSPEASRFAAFLESLVVRAESSDQGLYTFRDIFENLHLAGSEPANVTYSEVDADGVEALWCIPEGADPEHALVHFHMGGTVVASMHSDRKAAAHIAKAAGVRSLVVDYRRAPEHKYPAQVEDAETAFNWMVGQGYRPADIGSVGHSVGGYLAVALAVHLRDRGRGMPGAVLSISPWCDLELKDDAIHANAESDKLLSGAMLEFFRESWLGGTGVTWTDPRITLLNADVRGLPPTNVYYGTDEILAGEGAAFGDHLIRSGVDAEVHPLKNGQHSFIIAAGRVPEVDEAIVAMGRWLRSKLGMS